MSLFTYGSHAGSKMLPASDLDLVVLASDTTSEQAQAVFIPFYYMVEGVFGAEQTVRLLNPQDLIARSQEEPSRFLEMRWIAGIPGSSGAVINYSRIGKGKTGGNY